MKQVINGKEYNTETAILVASDRYWDGSNFERGGRNTYLYKTPNGRYFAHHTTQWQGERNTLEALTVESAKALYEDLSEHEVEYAEAFGVKPKAA